MKKELVLFVVFVFTQLAEARNFYKTDFSFYSSYTHIKTGSKDLFEDKMKIVYSDEGAFCYFQYNNAETPCVLVELKSYNEPVIELSIDVIKNIFVIAAQNTKELAPGEQAAVKRLIKLFPEALRLSPFSGASIYQLHDEQPEAIHVGISNLSYPKRY